MDKTTSKILELLFQRGKCHILTASVTSHRAAQKLIKAGFCIAVKFDKYDIEEFYSLRLRMTKEAKSEILPR